MRMRHPAAPLVAILTLLTTSVSASPLEDPTMGGAVFTGVTQPHATSLYINPAALSLAGSGWQIYFGGSLRLDQISIARNQLDPASGDVQPGGSVSALPMSPGGIIAAHNRFQNVTVGLGLHMPQSQTWISGQDATRYHTSGGGYYQFAATVAVSAQLHDRFILGAGLSLMGSMFDLNLSRDTALEAGSNATNGIASDCGGSPCGFENPLAEQRIRLRTATVGLRPSRFIDYLALVDTGNIALSGGVMIAITPEYWLGISYLSPPGLLSPRVLPGTVEVTDAERDGAAERSGDAEMVFKLPQTVNVGIRGPLRWLPGYDIIGEVRWQSTSRQRELDIRMFGGNLDGTVPEWYPRYRGLGNVWRLQTGLERVDANRLRWGGRVRIETGATSAGKTTPLQIEGFNMTLAGGAQLQISESVTLGGSYGLTWFPTVVASPSEFDPFDRLRCVDQMYDFEACRAAGEGRATPTASGTYGRLRHSLTLSLLLRL